MHNMNQLVARERRRDMRPRAVVVRTSHPPSPVRRRAASVVAQVARRLDADAARLALK